MPWLSPASLATVAMVVSDSPFWATERIVARINCSCRSSFEAVRLLGADLSAAFAIGVQASRTCHVKTKNALVTGQYKRAHLSLQ